MTIRINKNLGLSPLSASNTLGGRLKFQFDENSMNLNKAEYLMEYGPDHFHVGFLVAYHLDRVLGVRHWFSV